MRAVRRLARLVSLSTGVYGHADWLRRRCARYWQDELLIDDFNGDLRFWCGLSEHIGSHVFWRGSYSPDLLAFLDHHLTPEMVLLDVGANQGVVTVFAARRLSRGEVIAIEPVSEIFEKLARNTAENGFTNVRMFRFGLGPSHDSRKMFSGDRTFSHGTENTGLGTMYGDETRTQEIGTVDVLSLDELASDLDLTRLDIVKIDVEGAECDVLDGGRGTLTKFRPLLLIEIDDMTARRAGYSAEELLNRIRSLHYEVCPLRQDGSLAALDDSGAWWNAVCLPMP